MILRAFALFCLLQVALSRRYNSCGEGEFYNRLILACDQCTSECPQNSYIERACTPYEDTQCITCGVVDHENEDFKLKCGVQVDQDFKDAIEVQIRGQLEKTFFLKEVKSPKEEEETDSKVEQMLKKINDEWAEPEILSKEDDDDDETGDSENEADVAFVITNLEIEDDSDEPKPKIGQGAVPAWDSDSAETDMFRFNGGYKQIEIKSLKKVNQRRVEPKEIEDESDYEEEEPLKIAKQSEEDELKFIELDENDRRLISFEEVDEERDPFPDLLPQKIRKRPMPAVRLLDPLFDLDEEEENLKKVDDDSDSDSDDSDEDTPVIKEMIIERIKPQVLDFQTWKQQRRGGVKNMQRDDDDDEDSDSDSDESLENEMTAVKSEHVSSRKRFFRAMALTSFFVLVLVLLVWIAQLRRRNRVYRLHFSKLRYLTPEEHELIERAAGNLQKFPNIYENHVYESA